MQYLQENKGDLKVLIIKSPQYNEEHEHELYDHFTKKLKVSTVVRIEYVDILIKLPNGKFAHLISKIRD